MAIDLDSIETSEQIYFSSFQFAQPEPVTFHEVIFSNDRRNHWSLSPKTVCCTNITSMDEKVRTNFQKIKLMEAGGSINGSVSIGWGGSDGVEYTVSIGAEAHDDNGNYGEVQLEQSNDGGSITVSAGHEEGDSDR